MPVLSTLVLGALTGEAQVRHLQRNAGGTGRLDATTDRLSGAFKRSVQFLTAGVAAICAILFNIDALAIAQRLIQIRR
jgi:hypothetical protein